MSADPISTIRVRKRDGSLAPYDGNEVAASIMDSARGLDDAVARATLLQAEVEITLFDGMTTDALDEAVIQVALGNAKDGPFPNRCQGAGCWDGPWFREFPVRRHGSTHLRVGETG